MCYFHVLLQKPRNQKWLSLGQSTFSMTLWRKGQTQSAASQTGWSSTSGPNGTLASCSIQVATDSFPPGIMNPNCRNLMSDAWRGRIDRFRIIPSRHNKWSTIGDYNGALLKIKCLDAREERIKFIYKNIHNLRKLRDSMSDFHWIFSKTWKMVTFNGIESLYR